MASTPGIFAAAAVSIFLMIPWGVRAAHHHGIGEVRQGDVVRVASLALDQLGVFLARDRLPDREFLDRPSVGIVVHIHGDARRLWWDDRIQISDPRGHDKDRPRMPASRPVGGYPFRGGQRGVAPPVGAGTLTTI